MIASFRKKYVSEIFEHIILDNKDEHQSTGDSPVKTCCCKQLIPTKSQRGPQCTKGLALKLYLMHKHILLISCSI